jgi:hypothetical protein
MNHAPSVWHVLLAEQLRVPEDRVQRRAQLVADTQHELLLRIVGRVGGSGARLQLLPPPDLVLLPPLDLEQSAVQQAPVALDLAPVDQ